MSIRAFIAAAAAVMGVAAFACGGPAPDGSGQETASAAASCSPSPTPTPSCSPGYELVQDTSSSPYGQSGAGLSADGIITDICNFVKWVCTRKADPATPPCSGGAPTACPASTCWEDNGGGLCTQYSCAGVADGGAPNQSGGAVDETATDPPSSFCRTN